ncbi:MAG: hypothetical protein Q8M40_08170 [Legionella sp.]|nr:hypothetical protein [Legionella sp.]
MNWIASSLRSSQRHFKYMFECYCSPVVARSEATKQSRNELIG